MDRIYRTLPLHGLVNARELGGYPAAGGVTKFGRFIRHEIPVGLTEADIAFLKDYGVTTSIDLRSARETVRHRSELADVPWINYVNCPIGKKQVESGSAMKIESFVSWGVFYTQMAEESSEWVGRTLTLMAEAKGAVMFNCTTGKDRTGIISAMLLGLAGVSDEDIIADYAVSQIYMRGKYALLMETLPPIKTEDGENWDYTLDHPFFKTSPDNMAELLRYIREGYGNIEGFIKKCGIPPETVEKLREKLLI